MGEHTLWHKYKMLQCCNKQEENVYIYIYIYIYIFNILYIHTLREKCPYSALFWSAFSRIWTECGEILHIPLYSVQMRENADQNNPNTDTFYAMIRLYMYMYLCIYMYIYASNVNISIHIYLSCIYIIYVCLCIYIHTCI